MADLDVIERVTDLVANTTLTDHQIAKRVGVTPETVARVAFKVMNRVERDRDALTRCGGCGGMVLGFCRHCSIAASRRRRRPLASPLTSLGEVAAEPAAPDGAPSPAEIAAEAARIRAGWPAEKLQAAESDEWRPPVPISLGELAAAAAE